MYFFSYSSSPAANPWRWNGGASMPSLAGVYQPQVHRQHCVDVWSNVSNVGILMFSWGWTHEVRINCQHSSSCVSWFSLKAVWEAQTLNWNGRGSGDDAAPGKRPDCKQVWYSVFLSSCRWTDFKNGWSLYSSPTVKGMTNRSARTSEPWTLLHITENQLKFLLRK